MLQTFSQVLKQLKVKHHVSSAYHPESQGALESFHQTLVVGSPFQVRFSGPYTVKSRMSDRDYLISTPDRKKKVQWCHVNMLKAFLTPSLMKDTDTLPVRDDVAKPVASVGAGPTDDFDVPSESILTGKFLSSLPSHFSYLNSTGRSCEVAAVSFVTFFRYIITHDHDGA